MKKYTDKLSSTVQKKAVSIKGGPGGMMRGVAQANKQAPGMTGQNRSGATKELAAKGGPSNGMFKNQSVQPIKPGQTGKGGGGAGTSSGGKKRKGYGGDANGNPY